MTTKYAKLTDVEAIFAENERLKGENERLKAENSRLERALIFTKKHAENRLKEEQAKFEARLKSDQAKRECAEFAEKLVNEGRLAPIAKDETVEMLIMAHEQTANGTADFSEETAPLNVMKRFLSKQPKVVEFGEFATKNRAYSAPSEVDLNTIDREELHELVTNHAKQHNISYTEALQQITRS